MIELELISATRKDEIESSNEKGRHLSQENCKIIQIHEEFSRNFKLEIICLYKQQLFSFLIHSQFFPAPESFAIFFESSHKALKVGEALLEFTESTRVSMENPSRFRFGIVTPSNLNFVTTSVFEWETRKNSEV